MGERAQRFGTKHLRWLELRFSISILVLLLYPPAAIIATWELLTSRNHSTFRQLRQLSNQARHSGLRWGRLSLWRIWSARVAMCMARFLRYWPERLGQPRWARRCHFVGLERLQAILAEGRPVVLATLHYGNLTELSAWLRSRGIGAAFLVGRHFKHAYPSELGLLADSVNGLEGVPRVFGNEHQGLWNALEFLRQPNRVLVVAMEGVTKRDVIVQEQGYELRMAPGALFLAAMAKAAVIPCLISVRRHLNLTIFLGEPLPDEFVTCNELHPLGCERLLKELGRWITPQAEQSEPPLIGSFRFKGWRDRQDHPG